MTPVSYYSRSFTDLRKKIPNILIAVLSVAECSRLFTNWKLKIALYYSYIRLYQTVHAWTNVIKHPFRNMRQKILISLFHNVYSFLRWYTCINSFTITPNCSRLHQTIDVWLFTFILNCSRPFRHSKICSNKNISNTSNCEDFL